MDGKERRRCRRYQLRYPIIVSSSRAIGCEEGWHKGEIIDAGRGGIRLRLADFGALRVGTMLRLICQSAGNNRAKNRCLPVPIRGRVIWKNADTDEFALRYLQEPGRSP